MIKTIKRKITFYLRLFFRNKGVPASKFEREEINAINGRALQNVRSRVKNSGVIKIGFLVNDNTKWNSSNLIECFQADPAFECKIYLTITGRETDLKARREAYLKEKAYFSSLGLPLIDLYDVEMNKKINLDQHEADVLFFQQPWGMIQILTSIFGKILPVYMHYGYLVYANSKMQYKKQNFHPYLWRYFSQSEAHKKIHLQIDPKAEEQIVVTGYPKLDVYFSKQKKNNFFWKGTNIKFRVIYAPHHSLKKSSLKISTFDWNHNLIFDLAKNHRDVSWVYRPHGKLKHVVEKNEVMTKEEYQLYEERWNNLENACTYPSGDYFDIFKTSNVLITDCGSFLGEYMPTSNPVIWIISENPNVQLNEVGKKITDTYYKAHNELELIQHFNEVILNGNDYLKERRISVMNELFSSEESSSLKVVKYLKKELIEI